MHIMEAALSEPSGGTLASSALRLGVVHESKTPAQTPNNMLLGVLLGNSPRSFGAQGPSVIAVFAPTRTRSRRDPHWIGGDGADRPRRAALPDCWKWPTADSAQP